MTKWQEGHGARYSDAGQSRLTERHRRRCLQRAGAELFAYRPLRRLGGVADDAAVERVALDRLAAGFDDETADLLGGEQLRRGRAGVVIDQLVADGAVDVVGPVGQGGLGRADA